MQVPRDFGRRTVLTGTAARQFFTAATLALLLATPAAAQVRVIDGVTIDLRDHSRMQLFGIDTPEIGRPGAAEARKAKPGMWARPFASWRDYRCEQ